MARPLRVEYSGAWYHVMNRGLGKQTIFHQPAYYECFLELLHKAHERHQLEVHAYCLMNNHYHLLVRTPFPNLGKALQYIDGLFTVKHNRLFGRDGPLFRGRYKAIIVEADNNLVQLSRYIHLNPIKAKIVDSPEKYYWSSYKYYLTQKNKPNWLYLDETMNYFGNDSNKYRDFILNGSECSIEKYYEKPKKYPILGSEDFISEIKNRSQNPSKSLEIPQYSALVKKYLPSIESVVSATANVFLIEPNVIINRGGGGLNNIARQIAIYISFNIAGKSQKEIAKFFNLNSYSAVCQICRRLEQKIKEDANISNKVDLARCQVLTFDSSTNN